MNVFISGGCKNGKSTYAENIAVLLSKNAKPLYYIATMRPVDGEDELCIARHRQSREGLGFHTVECGEDISKITQLCKTSGTYLLDSATALLANEMFLPHAQVNEQAYIKIADELATVFCSVSNMVIVSDYLYSDAELYDEFTESYRKGLSVIDRRCAALCDVVIEVCFGTLIFHKGQALLEKLYERNS